MQIYSPQLFCLNIFHSSQDMITNRAEQKAMFNPFHNYLMMARAIMKMSMIMMIMNMTIHKCYTNNMYVISRGVVRSAASSYAAVPGDWFAPRLRHSVRMTYRPSAALRLLGSLRISHNKFLRVNK